MCELGKIVICDEVFILSASPAMPQKGHLEAKLLHVVTDLKLMSDFKLIFD
jgi:hypothetical protein